MLMVFNKWLKPIIMILWLIAAPLAAKSGLISSHFAPLCEVHSDPLSHESVLFLNHLQKAITIIAPINFLNDRSILIDTESRRDYRMMIEVDREKNSIALKLYCLYEESILIDSVHQSPVLSKRYHFKDTSDLLRIANQWGDLLIERIWGFKGSLSYPLAYIEFKDGLYQIVVSDVTTELYKKLYQSKFPMISLNWSPDAHYIAFIEMRDSGSVLNIIDVQSESIESIEGFSYIASPCFSKDGSFLYYIGDSLGLNQLIQYHLVTQKYEVLTSGEDWLVDVNLGWDDYHLILSINRTGSTQIHEFNLLSKKFKRLTFMDEECAAGLLSAENSSLFYSFVSKGHSLMMRRSFLDHQTHYVTIEGQAEGVTAPPCPKIIGFERYNHAEGKRVIIFKSLLDGHETFFSSQEDCYNPCWCPQPLFI